LLDPQSPTEQTLQIRIQVRVRHCGGEEAGPQRAQRASHGVHAEGVERVVVESINRAMPASTPLISAPLALTNRAAGMISTRPAQRVFRLSGPLKYRSGPKAALLSKSRNF
jgi:hypothetical protein